MEKALNTLPSTLETIDGAFLDYVENLNIFCNTINGWEKIPVIWSSAERAYQIKNNKEIRDKNGSLIPPIVSIERVSVEKDPKNKGIFQSNLSFGYDRFYYSRELKQDKTANFANADSLRNEKDINFVTSKKNNKKVYEYLSIPKPIYITVQYKIHILTNYQSQMNEAIQPFMARTAQNYFIIKKDNFSYESFMEQNFEQESISNLEENERKYKSTITVKVLGYLIGEGDNQEKPQILKTENQVEIKIPKENLFSLKEEDLNKKVVRASNEGRPVSSSLITKKVFLIGDGTSAVYDINHNLNSRDILVTIRETVAPYTSIIATVDYSQLNTISIDMGGAIGVDSHSVTILG